MNLLERLLERDIFIEPERFRTLTDEQKRQLETQLDTLSDAEVEEFVGRGSVEILWSYTKKPMKRTYQDFVGHFNRRLEQLGALLRQRQELSSPQSIAHIRKDERVTLIGLVWEKNETKNGHIVLELEDQSGRVRVLFTKKREDVFRQAQDVMLDEVIGITGLCAGDIVFADNLYHPDIPMSHELKKSPEPGYAIFISDLHFGNKNFFYKEFNAFIRWLHGELGGPKHQEVAAGVKYVFIVGDMIEGVGIYPGQKDDLSITDVREQYQEFAKHLQKLPKHVHIIMCPGNHEAGRLAEPQFNLYEDFTQDVLDMPNVHFVSNPSYVRIHRSKNFPGFTVLLYHGFSFIYYGNNVPSIFNEGGVNRPDLIMRYLLQRRHLAPSHTSNLYIPDPIEDPLVIREVPDFFASGHTHNAVHDTYRGVTLLNCSCWVPITEYQKASGLDCEPGKVPLVNLQTREVKLMNFRRGSDD